MFGAGEMSAKCLRNWENSDRSSQQKRYLIGPIVSLVHSFQRWPSIIPPLFQCLMFSGA